MNKMAFFHTTLALVFYIQQLLSATENTYYGLVREEPSILMLFGILCYVSTFCVVILVFVIIQSTLKENTRSYFRYR